MAKSGLNSALSGLSGTIDGWTYRRTPEGGLSIYRSKPSRKPASKLQKTNRELFRQAQAYAKFVMFDPLRRACYQRLGQERKRPPNTLLVSNYLNPPTIEVVDTAGYTGLSRQLIRVLAFDLIAVESVTITVRSPDGAVLESGAASPTHGIWGYRTTKPQPTSGAWQIDVTATNRAERSATMSLTRPLPAASP